jgi:AcrR family transcriptional regulator
MNRGITPQSPKAKLLDAALSLIREKGYSSTSVGELCAQASVTKGAFFHYFKCKDALAVAAAMKRYRIRAPWTAASLALHTQAVLQGAFIMAKAKGGAAIAAASIDHLHRYIELLFQPARRNRKETS